VFFGANDASLPDAPNKQHIPLEEYKANLEKIITHPKIVAHNPRIILIAPPPINEHLWWPRDKSNGYTSVSRIASVTKDYADAARDVGAKLNVPVLDLWKAFMEKADFKMDAWKLGEPLPGSLDIPQNDALVELMYDGKGSSNDASVYLLTNDRRPSLQPSGLQYLLSGVNEGNSNDMA
jgi:lysophospholipase L1-like esterase